MNLKKSYYILIACIFCSFSIPTCESHDPTWKGTIQVIDGVSIVKNPKDPYYRDQILYLTEEISFNGTHSRPEAKLVRPFSLQVDDKGQVYILDVHDGYIKTFDSFGRFIRLIGRRGEAPGEMPGPLSIQITGDGEIVVYCVTASKLIYFSADGRILRENQVSTLPRSLLIEDSEGNYICQFSSERETNMTFLEKYGSNQQKLFRIMEHVSPSTQYYFPLNPMLIFNVAPDNHIVWAVTDRYEINVVDPSGKKIRSIQKQSDPLAMTEADKQIIIDCYGTPGPADKFPSHLPPIQPDTISIDENGRIYIKTFKRNSNGKGYIYDVFDPKGRFITKISLNQIQKVPLVWRKNKLHTIEEDESGRFTVRRYSADWQVRTEE